MVIDANVMVGIVFRVIGVVIALMTYLHGDTKSDIKDVKADVRDIRTEMREVRTMLFQFVSSDTGRRVEVRTSADMPLASRRGTVFRVSEEAAPPYV